MPCTGSSRHPTIMIGLIPLPQSIGEGRHLSHARHGGGSGTPVRHYDDLLQGACLPTGSTSPHSPTRSGYRCTPRSRSHPNCPIASVGNTRKCSRHRQGSCSTNPPFHLFTLCLSLTLSSPLSSAILSGILHPHACLTYAYTHARTHQSPSPRPRTFS